MIRFLQMALIRLLVVQDFQEVFIILNQLYDLLAL